MPYAMDAASCLRQTLSNVERRHPRGHRRRCLRRRRAHDCACCRPQRDRRRYALDARQRQHEDLQKVVDDGAVLLGAGQTNLRSAQEAVSAGGDVPAEVKEWSSQVHLLGQRLLLRLPASDPIIVSYEAVREALLALGESYGDEERYQQAASEFEARRDEFLTEARANLDRTRKP
jgi:hypothetical protein